MTTLEKAARALCEELFGPYDPEDVAPSSISRQARLGATAALSVALLDPSDEVVEAAEMALFREMPLDCWPARDQGKGPPTFAWKHAARAMLRAAGVKITETQ